MSNTFSILSTRELDKNFNQEILSLGIRVDAVPFISIEYVDNVEVIPVPRNSAYTAEQGETTVDNQTLENYILSKCVSLTS